jgi:hypothetical protein
MTIKELVQLLEQFNGDKKVIIETPEGDIIEDMIVNVGLGGEIVIGEF